MSTGKTPKRLSLDGSKSRGTYSSEKHLKKCKINSWTFPNIPRIRPGEEFVVSIQLTVRKSNGCMSKASMQHSSVLLF